jgi:hypothetical protein
MLNLYQDSTFVDDQETCTGLPVTRIRPNAQIFLPRTPYQQFVLHTAQTPSLRLHHRNVLRATRRVPGRRKAARPTRATAITRVERPLHSPILSSNTKASITCCRPLLLEV